jgi:hypothetical protein
MRIFFRLAAGLIASGLAQTAAAECFQPGQARQPTAATFADGATVDVLERTPQSLRYKTKSTPTSKPVELKTFGGIFTLYADTGTTRFEFDWQDDLAKAFPLRVGQKVSATANILSDTTRVFAMSIEVMAAETLRIGACEYPVLKIVQTSGDVGKSTATLTRYFNPDSLLTLRTERSVPATTTEPAKIVSNQIMTLE